MAIDGLDGKGRQEAADRRLLRRAVIPKSHLYYCDSAGFSKLLVASKMKLIYVVISFDFFVGYRIYHRSRNTSLIQC